MGLYRARDLVRVPGLLSLMRVPLAAAFPFLVDRPPVALALVAVSGLTDLADGWYARRFDQVTPTGAAIDPLTDKVFVLAVVSTLVVRGMLSPVDLLLLGTRELGELPLVLWIATSRIARKSRALHASANMPGKVATALQFAAIAAVLLRSRRAHTAIVITAGVGALAAIVYWRRALRDVKRTRGNV